MQDELSPEVYFLRYAFPCSHVLLKVRKEITEEDYEKMKKAAIDKENLPREYMEKIFFRAFKRINKIAKKMGKDKWDREVIKEYFRVRHNPVLEKLDYPETFKEQCRIHIAEIKSLEDDQAIVEYLNIDNKVIDNSGNRHINSQNSLMDNSEKRIPNNRIIHKKRKVKTSFLPNIKLGDKVTIHYSYAVEKIS